MDVSDRRQVALVGWGGGEVALVGWGGGGVEFPED